MGRPVCFYCPLLPSRVDLEQISLFACFHVLTCAQSMHLMDWISSSIRAGMIGWIVQGLGKVVPQPDEKYKGQTEPEEVTEVETHIFH